VTGTPSKTGGSNAYPLDWRVTGLSGVQQSFGAPGAVFFQVFDESFDAVAKLTSSFAEKRVLLDVTAGWHHEDHASSPTDGSKLGSTDPAALVNQPWVTWQPRSITEFLDLPHNVVADCQSDQNQGATRCPTPYITG